MRPLITRLVLSTVAMLAVGCTDIGSFSTDFGECYRGNVVAAEFVRSGFDQNVQLSLTLDVSALSEGRGRAGEIWTSDGRFNGSTVSQMEQLAHDNISLFQFPGGRIRNYLAHATPSDDTPAAIVISLMENDKVEVRVIRAAIESDRSIVPLFGVFRLSLDEQCNLPTQ
ncbi:MAG: hypothetical protein JRF63_04815 [Deltaproteobacteria bacterium]|nr:hypothetical protein [Deltaproteobacteria bacterium]